MTIKTSQTMTRKNLINKTAMVSGLALLTWLATLPTLAFAHRNMT